MKKTILVLSFVLAPLSLSWSNDLEFSQVDEQPQVCETVQTDDDWEWEVRKAVWKCSEYCAPIAAISVGLLPECYAHCLDWQL